MGGRGSSSRMQGGTNIERTNSVDTSKYTGYARILARESNSMMKNDTEDRWLMYKNTTQNGESFVRYSLEDNYIAAIASTNRGSGATSLLASALSDIQKYGDEKSPVEWQVVSPRSIEYYDHIGLAKYRNRDTYQIPQSELSSVIEKLRRRSRR